MPLSRSFLDILRPPDTIRVFTDSTHIALEADSSGIWRSGSIRVGTHADDDLLAVTLSSPAAPILRLHLRWTSELSPIMRWLGDAWERGYGDLGWRNETPERILPWYCASFDGEITSCYGVQTSPNAFCFWQTDSQGISLWADVRSGGVGVELGDRILSVCNVLCHEGSPGDAPFVALAAFCQRMCPQPLLPKAPVYGQNDWYYAYGNNSAEQALEDAKRIIDLSPTESNRPFSVIDAGWQPNAGTNGGPWNEGNSKFPDMPGLAHHIKSIGARPGIWTRPLAAAPDAPHSWRLARDPDMLDPTVPDVMHQITQDVSRLRSWGYEMVKHDFTTFDIFGRWGFTMGAELTDPGWRFAAGSRQTSAEVILSLYKIIREAADDSLVIGCNTISHLSAGSFEVCRIGDDTSGMEWERTRRMGVNSLAFRAGQQGTFYAADADCVGITPQIPWEQNRQWLDLVARSGTPLFISLQPDTLDPEKERALRAAFERAAIPQPLGQPLDWMETASPRHWRFGDDEIEYQWLDMNGASPVSC